MNNNPFRDRRSRRDRRHKRSFAGKLHCRRHGIERRQSDADDDTLGWWLKTDYVVKEVKLSAPR